MSGLLGLGQSEMCLRQSTWSQKRWSILDPSSHKDYVDPMMGEDPGRADRKVLLRCLVSWALDQTLMVEGGYRHSQIRISLWSGN